MCSRDTNTIKSPTNTLEKRPGCNIFGTRHRWQWLDLGFTSAGAPSATGEAIRAVTLSVASTNVGVETFRVGSGTIKPLSSWQEATTPCFYQGCGAYAPVSSSLDTVWQRPGLTNATPGAPAKVPLRLTITDLEANNGDITKLTAIIKKHVAEGAVIGVMALKLPFNGSVFNSNAQVIFKGKTERPIYLLATGPQHQVHKLLDEIKSNASISGIAADSIYTPVELYHLGANGWVVEGLPKALGFRVTHSPERSHLQARE